MAEAINLTIDGISVRSKPGTTILKAADSIGIKIPSLCYHEHCTANGLCRICVVEAEGARTLLPSCIAEIREGMVIHTRSERVLRARRTILEMLSSSVDLSETPEALSMLSEYEVDKQRFPDAQPRCPAVLDDNPMYIRDYAKCILCWRCVQVCAEDAQYTYAINFSKRGYATQISTFYERELMQTTCVFCGQCIGVCPTGALKPKREFLLEKGLHPHEIMSLTVTERKKINNRAKSGGVA